MTSYNDLYVPLPVLQWGKLTAPAKREFRKGVAARKRGSPDTNNPWRRSIGGRNYCVFEDYWGRGWKACDSLINERQTHDHLGT